MSAERLSVREYLVFYSRDEMLTLGTFFELLEKAKSRLTPEQFAEGEVEFEGYYDYHHDSQEGSFKISVGRFETDPEFEARLAKEAQEAARRQVVADLQAAAAERKERSQLLFLTRKYGPPDPAEYLTREAK